MQDKVKEYFSTPEKYLHKGYGVRLRAELVRRLLGDVKGAYIMDAGCGDGGVSMQFLSGNNQIHFCDLTYEMLERVRSKVPEKYASKVSYYNGSIEDIPWSTPKFQLVLCMGVLAHVNSVRSTLEKLTGLLDSKGKLVLQFSDSERWLTRLAIRRGGYKYRVNPISYSSLEQMCASLGLLRTDEIKYHISLPGMGRLPDDVLYFLQAKSARPGLLNHIATDCIWVLEKR